MQLRACSVVAVLVLLVVLLVVVVLVLVLLGSSSSSSCLPPWSSTLMLSSVVALLGSPVARIQDAEPDGATSPGVAVPFGASEGSEQAYLERHPVL